MDETPDKPKAEQPKAKRCRWQFSMKSMFAAVAVVAVLLTIVLRWIEPVRQQQSAGQWIERAGGCYGYSLSAEDEGWLTTRLRDWLPRDYFDTIAIVRFSNCTVSDVDIARLRCLKQLKWLELVGTNITNAGLEIVASFEQLQGLRLNGTQVSDSGLAHLRALTQLRDLDLDQTQISDAGLAHLGGLSQLESLSLFDTHVTDAGLTHLSGLNQLEILNLSGTKVTDAALPILTAKTQLQSLYVHQTQITKAGKSQLKKALPECRFKRWESW